jgi:anti-sigma factor RsiW
MFLRGREGKCRRVGALLSEYIDGRLRGGDAEFVDAHLEKCARCAAELEGLRLTVRLLGRVRSVPVPRSFAVREADVASAPARRPWWLLPVPVPGGVREGVGWTSVLAPERMGWLRPATAVVAAALVLVVALDFSQIVPHGANVELIEQLEPSRAVVVTSLRGYLLRRLPCQRRRTQLRPTGGGHSSKTRLASGKTWEPCRVARDCRRSPRQQSEVGQ